MILVALLATQQRMKATDTKELGAYRGYVIDHVIPLCAGGADDPLNMQWQTIAEAKAKDREEKLANVELECGGNGLAPRFHHNGSFAYCMLMT